MLQAALAFDAALRQTAPSDISQESYELLVFEIKTTKHPNRRVAFAHDSEIDLLKGDLRINSNPMVKVFSSKQVLNTSVLRQLKSKSMLGKLLIVVGLIILFLSIVDPGQQRLEADDPFKPGHTVNVWRSHDATQVLRTMALLLSAYIVFEQTSYDLFKLCSWQFECLAIAGCAVVCESAHLWHTFEICRSLGWHSRVFEVGESFARVLVHWLCAMMDAWTNSNPNKVLITFLFLVDLINSFVTNRFFIEWSDYQTCTWYSCTTPQQLYLNARVHEIVFVTRILFDYLAGHRYAVLKSRFVDPEETDNIGDVFARLVRTLKLFLTPGAARQLDGMIATSSTTGVEQVELPYQHKCRKQGSSSSSPNVEQPPTREATCCSEESAAEVDVETHARLDAFVGVSMQTACHPSGPQAGTRVGTNLQSPDGGESSSPAGLASAVSAKGPVHTDNMMLQTTTSNNHAAPAEEALSASSDISVEVHLKVCSQDQPTGACSNTITAIL